MYLSTVKTKMQEQLDKRLEICAKHLEKGVIIIDLATTYIDEDVQIGNGTTLNPNTIIEGKTIIGENCVVGPNSKLVDMEVCDNVNIQFTVAHESKIGSFTEVGPYAYIRPHSEIGEHCKVGDFVEIKNAKLGNKTKASHLTYVGDAEVGCGINFGCGTVTVNYDGNKKHKTIIHDGAFIGCNTNLVAPVTVNEGAYIAAGSTITDDVPEKSLAIARSRQINKTGWHRK